MRVGCGLRRLSKALAACITVAAVYNFFFLKHFNAVPDHISQMNVNNTREPYHVASLSFATGWEMDSQQIFQTRSFWVPGEDWDALSSGLVCLGSQTSVDRLHWVLPMVEAWDGPISISVFTPDVEYSVARLFIQYLRQCYPSVAKRVSFHATFPVDHAPATTPGLEIFEYNLSKFSRSDLCSTYASPSWLLNALLDLRPSAMLGWREQFAYPQNHLRNTAKTNCKTKYALVPDLDMIPTNSLRRDLDHFFADGDTTCQEGQKCVFVIPTYELHDNVTKTPGLDPSNKTALLSLVDLRLARIFHDEIYSPNQGASNLSDHWEKIPETPTMQVSYDVTHSYGFGYEPVFVAEINAPRFDERFLGFGFTRNTQAYEMFVSDYRFKVLSNAFLKHWGFQYRKSRPKWRTKQEIRNQRRLSSFFKDMLGKYGKDPFNKTAKNKMRRGL